MNHGLNLCKDTWTCDWAHGLFCVIGLMDTAGSQSRVLSLPPRPWLFGMFNQGINPSPTLIGHAIHFSQQSIVFQGENSEIFEGNNHLSLQVFKIVGIFRFCTLFNCQCAPSVSLVS